MITIHVQESTGTRTSRTTTGARSPRKADSRSVGGGSVGVTGTGTPINVDQRRVRRDADSRRGSCTAAGAKAITRGDLRAAPGKRSILSVVLAADVLPRKTERTHTAPRRACQCKTIRGRMACVVEVHWLGRIRIDALDALGSHVEEIR